MFRGVFCVIRKEMMDLIIDVLPSLIIGLKQTMIVFFAVIILSIPLGFLVSAVYHFSGEFVRKIIRVYIYIMRGSPLLLQLMFIFFGLPYIGIKFDRIPAAVFAFTLNYAAYYAEIFRGGINSVDKSQFEAAKVLGLSKTYAFLKIITPQTIKTVFPSVCNEIITLLKDTSLIYILGLTDMLKAAKTMANHKVSLMPYLIALAIYLLITAVLTKLMNRVERRIEF